MFRTPALRSLLLTFLSREGTRLVCFRNDESEVILARPQRPAPPLQSPGHGGFPTRMPLGMHFGVLGSGKAPDICFSPEQKQMSGALPNPSTSKYIPKGILVGNPPWLGLWLPPRSLSAPAPLLPRKLRNQFGSLARGTNRLDRSAPAQRHAQHVCAVTVCSHRGSLLVPWRLPAVEQEGCSPAARDDTVNVLLFDRTSLGELAT